MDKIKRKRTVQRTAFTKALNAFNETYSDTVLDKRAARVAFELLEIKYSELEASNNEIIELMYADKDTADTEFEDEDKVVTEYRNKFLDARIRAKELMEPRTEPRNGETNHQSAIADSSERKTFKLPRIEFVKFSGEVREWLPFWSSFKKVHEDNDITKEDKFQYLQQAMVPNSAADRLVKSFPRSEANYDQAIKSLKGRYGCRYLQVKLLVRDFLQVVFQSAVTPKKDFVLTKLYDQIETHIRSLESLSITIEKFGLFLYPLVESSLPEEILCAWQRSPGYSASPQDDRDAETVSKEQLTALIKFLGDEVHNAMVRSEAKKDLYGQPISNNDNLRKEKAHGSKHVPSATNLLTTKREKVCIFCSSSDHDSANCTQAQQMNLQQRKETVKAKRACFICLNIGHNYKKCHVKLKCIQCSRRHVTLMCPNEERENNTDDTSKTVKQQCILASMCKDPEVYLQTLRVKLFNGENEIIVRAVIDSGSQRSYITKEAAARVKYKPIAEQLLKHSLFSGMRTDIMTHTKYLVRLSSLDDSYSCNFSALDERVICDDIPIIKRGRWCDEVNELNITISDLESNNEAVSILIGADIAGKLTTGRRHVLKCGLVVVETHLGWTVMGAENDSEERVDPVSTVTTMFVNSHKVSELWSLDVLGIKDPIENKRREERDKEVNDALLQTVKFNKEGRYEVQLPWLESHPTLSDNKNLAARRLQSTIKKLRTDGFYNDYDAVFDEWLAEGIIELVPSGEEDKWGHYLPHRHVIKENSTTRIRPVFDASAKEKRFPSLNDCLEKGPNLIELVSSILLRFREGKIGVISDIKKAFLQISLNVNDRDFLRFLWFDKKGNPITFRHCRVVFGVSCSPFILGAVINMHLNNIIKSIDEDSRVEFSKDNISKLLNSFYVDNCVTSINSLNQLNDFMHDAKTVMQLVSFDLRGWEYSGDNPFESQATVLGLLWNKTKDTLSLNVPPVEDISKVKVTKRSILSTAHRIFDPLGFACPVVLCPRILLQETWAQNLSWDDEVGEDCKKRFLDWLENIKSLNELQIPRCMLGEIDRNDKISLHTFCDASKVAYAAVVFVRIENDSRIKVNFVHAKSRVAPAKKKGTDGRQSIPRLELLAANIGARLTASILESLKLKNVKVYYWSDSSTVLAWIHKESNWATFVWNRVKEIRSLSDSTQWRLVPGHLNPADLPSRGCTVDQLLISRWWKGPEWLREKSENWPNNEPVFDEIEVNKELKKSEQKIINSSVLLIATQNNDYWYKNKFSSYTKLVRVLAWIYRFYFNVKNSNEIRKTGELTFEELKNAETRIVRLIQTESFDANENNTRIKHLKPFKDEEGIIRLNTKIILREDTFNFRCPILLPGNHTVVNLIIFKKHKELNHAGVEITMSKMREDYWILGGRKIIRSIIKKCTDCRRHDAKALQAVPVPLPLNRVRDAAVFEIVGVDFTGPIYLKGGQKAWICLFTCAVFRAVHLELVTSLSTATFLMALRRHIARRGRPAVIYSDNGTNFVGLNNLFKNINFDKLASTVAIEKIEWRFNPPTAAWWGGFWERLNGILKRLLRRTLKRSCLDYEEMLTVLVDCEAVINSRPITFMSENDENVVPLTPAMFLQEVKEIGVLDLDYIENKRLGKRFMYRQNIKNSLRARFRSEYLGALVQKNYDTKEVRCVSVGDVVLVHTENVKRIDWPLARVKELIFGKDNNVRVVRLSTADGEMIRPIQRIYPLEIHLDNSESNTNEIIINKYENKNKMRQNDDELSLDNEQAIITRSGRKIVKPDRFTYT